MANVVDIIIRGIDRTKEGFTGPIKNLDDLGKRIDQVKPLFAAMAATASAAFAAMARQAINLQDETSKLSQKMGFTTEEVSTLGFALDQSGVTMEQFKTGMAKFNKEVNSGGAMLKSLGIELLNSEGMLRSNMELLEEVADRFADMADGAQKSALAQKLFERSGAELIPFLNQGKQGIREMREEARLLGLEISGPAAKAAEQFNDNMSKLKDSLFGIVSSVVQEFIPAMAANSEALVQWVKDNGVVEGSINTLIDLVRTLKFYLDILITTFKGLMDALRLLSNYIENAVAAWVDAIMIFVNAFGGLSDAINFFIDRDWAKAKTAFSTTLAQVGADFETFKESVKAVISGVKDDWGKLIDTLASGPTAPPLWQGRSVNANTNFTTSGTPPPAAIASSVSVDAGGLTMEAMRLWREINAETLSETERLIALEKLRYEKRLENIGNLAVAEGENFHIIEAAHAEHAAHIEEIHKFSAQRRAQMNKQFADASAQMFGNLAATAAAFGEKGFKAWKAFATAQALVNTYSSAVAAYNAMAGIPFVGPALATAAAAAAIAAGLANVAVIQSTNPVGAAHGGMDFVPAEQTFLLNKGERVISPRQNEDLTDFLNGGGGGGGPMVVNVMLDNEVLARAIGQMSRDGRLDISARAVT